MTHNNNDGWAFVRTLTKNDWKRLHIGHYEIPVAVVKELCSCDETQASWIVHVINSHAKQNRENAGGKHADLETAKFSYPSHPLTPHKVLTAIESYMSKHLFDLPSQPLLHTSTALEPPWHPFPFKVTAGEIPIATLTPHHLDEHFSELTSACNAALKATTALPATSKQPSDFLREWDEATNSIIPAISEANGKANRLRQDNWRSVIAFVGGEAGAQDARRAIAASEKHIEPFKAAAPVAYAEKVNQLYSQPRKKKEYTGNKRAQKETENEEMRQKAIELFDQHAAALRLVTDEWLAVVSRCEWEAFEVVQAIQEHCAKTIDSVINQGEDRTEALRAAKEELTGVLAEYREKWRVFVEEQKAMSERANEDLGRSIKKLQETPTLDEQKVLVVDKEWLKRLRKAEKRSDEEALIAIVSTASVVIQQMIVVTLPRLITLAQDKDADLITSLRPTLADQWQTIVQYRTVIQAEYSALVDQFRSAANTVVLRLLHKNINDGSVAERDGKPPADDAQHHVAHETKPRQVVVEHQAAPAEVVPKQVEPKPKKEKEKKPKEKSPMLTAETRTAPAVVTSEPLDKSSRETSPVFVPAPAPPVQTVPELSVVPETKQKEPEKPAKKMPVVSVQPHVTHSSRIFALAQELENELSDVRVMLAEKQAENEKLRKSLAKANAEIARLNQRYNGDD